MSAIELKNISKKYSKLTVVDNLSLTIESGEAIVLVGPSGSGKTTILKIIAGLTPTTSGSLLIEGQDARKLKPRDREIGMVFQNYALYPHLTVYQNIAFGIGRKDKCRDQVLEAAELLQLKTNLKQKPDQLSGGQQQRVAIARKPKLLLLDEPLSNLDAHLRNQMRKELNNLRSRLDATFVYVTHDQTEAMTLGDRIVVLDQGRCQQIGRPEAIYTRPQNLFTACFMGNPAMNLFKAQLKEQDGEISLLLLGKVLNLPPVMQKKVYPLKKDYFKEGLAEAIIGLRPEDIYLSNSEEVSFLAEIEWTEWIGPESILHLKVGQASFRLRSGGNFSMGKDLSAKEYPISFDLLKIHLFNENGERWN